MDNLRITWVVSHPIQYYTPLFKELSKFKEFNLTICYLPLIVDSNNILSSLEKLNTLVVGNIDPHVSSKIAILFNTNNLKIVTMTSKSAEIYRLAYSTYIHYKVNFANFLGELMINYGSSDETPILLKSLGYDESISNENLNFGFGHLLP